MGMAMMSWLLAIPLLGFATGLRSLTPIAVLCWFGYLARLPVHYSWAHWSTTLVSVIVFTVLALGEYIGDKLPKTPARTAPFSLAVRVVFGGLVGAIARRRCAVRRSRGSSWGHWARCWEPSWAIMCGGM